MATNLSVLVRRAGLISAAVAGVIGGSAWGTDVPLVMPAALDQPRINAMISWTATGAPLSFEGVFNIEAFYDTGASGILISGGTASLLGINPSVYGTQTVQFYDTGVGPNVQPFHVSNPLYLGLAAYAPDTDTENPASYTHQFGAYRGMIGIVNEIEPNPLLENLDVFGMPLMRNKVVVMDPTPVNTFADTMRTTVTYPGDPTIPTTNLHVKLSYANFAHFTTTLPTGAPGPEQADNPFIGPAPAGCAPLEHAASSSPGVTVEFGTAQATASFLLDTGAAASIISKDLAGSVGVTYKAGTEGTDAPILIDNTGNEVPDQFSFTIGGIGGTSKLAGFFLDKMVLPTEEGVTDSSKNINFIGAPVLVGDISVEKDGTKVTLDGIFGMNFLVASCFFTEASPLPIIENLSTSPFTSIVFDEPAGKLGLNLDPAMLTKADLAWVASPLGLTSWIAGVPTLFALGDNRAVGGIFKTGDHVVFDDATEATIVDIPYDVMPEAIVVNNSLRDYTFTNTVDFPGVIAGNANLAKRGTGMLTIETENTYSGPTEVIEGTVVFAARQDIGDVVVHGDGTAIMQTSQTFADVSVGDGLLKFTPGGDKTLVADGVETLGSGRLDLADNRMVVKNGDLAAITRELRKGYHGGAWDGPGIQSSTAAADAAHWHALAAIANSTGGATPSPLTTTFGGESVGLGDILIKYTYYGDADLDGDVDGNDVAKWALNFTGELGGGVTATKSWAHGDWDYDGDVDGNDVAKWALTFTGELGGALSIEVQGVCPEAVAILGNMGITVVPEPMGTAMLALAGIFAARRRRAG